MAVYHAPPLSSSTPELCKEDVIMFAQGRQPIGSSSSMDLNSSRDSPLSPLHYAVNNGAAASPGSATYSPVHTDIRHEFRVMLNKVADMLDENNVSSIAFIHELPSQVKKDKRPLACFEHLQKVGVFSWKETNPLKKLLQDIDRHDLVTTLVEEYEILRQENTPAHVRRQNTEPLIPAVLPNPWSQQCPVNSLPTSTFAFTPGNYPQQETSGTPSESEEALALSTGSHKEEQSELISGLSGWDLVDIPIPRSQSSENITEVEQPVVTDQLSQSMPSKTKLCQLLLRTIKPPGTSTTWSLQAKELLPSMSSSAKSHVKLNKKSIDVKCIELPKQKFTCIFTIHPPTSTIKYSDFLSLEVTVTTKYVISTNAHLDLAITIRTNSGLELGKHHIEKPPQSFHLPEFLSAKKLQKLDPNTKIVMEIQAKIAVTMDYVVVDLES